MSINFPSFVSVPCCSAAMNRFAGLKSAVNHGVQRLIRFYYSDDPARWSWNSRILICSWISAALYQWKWIIFHPNAESWVCQCGVLISNTCRWRFVQDKRCYSVSPNDIDQSWKYTRRRPNKWEKQQHFVDVSIQDTRISIREPTHHTHSTTHSFSRAHMPHNNWNWIECGLFLRFKRNYLLMCSYFIWIFLVGSTPSQSPLKNKFAKILNLSKSR